MRNTIVVIVVLVIIVIIVVVVPGSQPCFLVFRDLELELGKFVE